SFSAQDNGRPVTHSRDSSLFQGLIALRIVVDLEPDVPRQGQRAYRTCLVPDVLAETRSTRCSPLQREGSRGSFVVRYANEAERSPDGVHDRRWLSSFRVPSSPSLVASRSQRHGQARCTDADAGGRDCTSASRSSADELAARFCSVKG